MDIGRSYLPHQRSSFRCWCDRNTWNTIPKTSSLITLQTFPKYILLKFCRSFQIRDRCTLKNKKLTLKEDETILKMKCNISMQPSDGPISFNYKSHSSKRLFVSIHLSVELLRCHAHFLYETIIVTSFE